VIKMNEICIKREDAYLAWSKKGKHWYRIFKCPACSSFDTEWSGTHSDGKTFYKCRECREHFRVPACYTTWVAEMNNKNW